MVFCGSVQFKFNTKLAQCFAAGNETKVKCLYFPLFEKQMLFGEDLIVFARTRLQVSCTFTTCVV